MPALRLLPFLLLIWLLPTAAGLAGEVGRQVVRQVVLSHRVVVTNPADEPIERYYHRVSLPVARRPGQQLLAIDYPYPEPWREKLHKNGIDRYLEVKLEIPPRATVEREFRFTLRLAPYRLDPGGGEPGGAAGEGKRHLAPGRLVESDHPRLTALAAGLPGGSAWERLQQAFRYPGVHLDYRDMDRSEGALFAAERGYGDCTEYAALFVALARDLGYPARLTTEFHLTGAGDYPRPNHHAAEVLVDGRWLPADPNLAAVAEPRYGLGFGAAGKILLQREGAFSWGNWYPGSPVKPQVRVGWRVEPDHGGG